MLKKLFLLPLMALCLLASTLAPKQAHADPLFLFAFTALTGGWAAVTYEECKEDGLDAEDCAKRTWQEREPLDYSKLNQ